MLLLNESQIMEKSLAVKKQMTFKEFVTFNNIDLDIDIYNKIFYNVSNNIPIYIDDSMVEYFEYKGNLEIQKNILKKFIETNFSEYQNKLWYSYTDKEYLDFCNDNKENISRYSAQTNHLLIMPKLFKEIALHQTDPNSKIWKYYIDLIDVNIIFIKYQNRYQVYSLNDQLDILNDELDFQLNSKE
jgi:hypothetical protein